MSVSELQRIAGFRLSFARRQAAEVTEVPGGVAVLDQEFAASHEHNQLFISGNSVYPAELPAVADGVLGHLGHRRITVLDDAAGVACVPALTAAGYEYEKELVMLFTGAVPAPVVAAEPVGLAELRTALHDQFRIWMPQADQTVVDQLVERRKARLRGAPEVRTFAVRDEKGTVAAWADLYADPEQGVAQIEDVVTADAHRRRGFGDTVLATALRYATRQPLVFLIADAEDWPRDWYARRGFEPIGHSHAFVRTVKES